MLRIGVALGESGAELGPEFGVEARSVFGHV